MMNQQGPGVRRARRDRKFRVLSRLTVVPALVVAMFGLILSALPAAASCSSSCTIWNPATQPTGQTLFTESVGVEVGLKFTTDVPGFVTGLRFYKDPAMTGTHIGHVWDASGTKLAEATYSGETSSGWQQVNLSAPVAITPNTPYVTSLFVSDRNYVATAGPPAGPAPWPYPTDNPPLHGTAGVFAEPVSSPGGFPNTMSANGANYWVDLVFQPENADLSIVKSAPKLLLLSDHLTYSITVSNAGPTGATGVTVTDPLSSRVKFVSVAASQGSCAQSAGMVTCSLGSLAVGGKATVTIKVDPVLLGTVNNTATVKGNGSDPNPNNNSSSVSTLVILSLL
jgi:uncharacterized repeat protein (TIGR01451 family)